MQNENGDSLTDNGSHSNSPSHRLALVTIIGFWSFYYLIVTIRSFMLGFEHQMEMLGLRAIVALAAGTVSYIIFLILRTFDNSPLKTKIIVIVCLSIPSAITYATINWAVFLELNEEFASKQTRSIIINGPNGQKEIEVPVNIGALDKYVDPEDLDDMIEARREAIEEAISASREAAQDAAEAQREAAEYAREWAEEYRRELSESRSGGDEGEHGMPPMPPVPPSPPAPASSASVIVNIGPDAEDMDKGGIFIIADHAANGYFLFIAWASILLALDFAARATTMERRASAFRAAAQSAELRALRYQVNPHFLFNTLNSLSSLIMTGKQDDADRMVMNLSTFFRTSLTGDPTEDVALSEEIDLQKLYLSIEEVRFPGRLKTVIDIPESLDNACVPGLILQPIVENSVKYAVSPTRDEVTIRVSARAFQERLVITVEDNGKAAPDTVEGGTGLGLRNVRDRLSARFGEEGQASWARMESGGFRVELSMPLIRGKC